MKEEGRKVIYLERRQKKFGGELVDGYLWMENNDVLTIEMITNYVLQSYRASNNVLRVKITAAPVKNIQERICFDNIMHHNLDHDTTAFDRKLWFYP
ncbi:hypothetical protein TSUD_225490 [Trifolium subterraneum]|uniref:Uncharacterized protein n=1 Tax=Trifolium subterraneum TaxID=3900 RepID=A0A2Z6M2P7_TRISU|nr:hypothetical protein TSUD_225490 [Trifolium subterraneum]